MKVVLITGMLASGKSIALRVFQDMDYYVIDNMPPSLIPPFLQLAVNTKPKIEKVAFVVDVRAEGFFNSINETIKYLDDNTIFDILYIDASDEVLLSRYKLNRRRHIAFDNDRISEAIRKERDKLQILKNQADYIIDTTNLKESEFKAKIHEIYDGEDGSERKFLLNITSFGFKYGILKDADLVFDARFAPNPYYLDELKPKSGLDEEVRNYVLSFSETQTFIDKIVDMLNYLLPFYIKEGKTQLIVGIGCSGGRHRSVAITEELKERLEKIDCTIITDHRDIDKDVKL